MYPHVCVGADLESARVFENYLGVIILSRHKTGLTDVVVFRG